MAVITGELKRHMEERNKLSYAAAKVKEGEQVLFAHHCEALAKKRDRDPHFALCLRAADWAERVLKCGWIIRDGFGCQTATMEQPDVFGMRSGVSVVIEVKVSRADFLGDKKKKFRQQPELGLGDFRIYACPPNVIKISDLPKGWGLIYIHDKKIEKVCGIPKGVQFHRKSAPFKSNVEAERDILYQFARRMEIRNHTWKAYGIK